MCQKRFSQAVLIQSKQGFINTQHGFICVRFELFLVHVSSISK